MTSLDDARRFLYSTSGILPDGIQEAGTDHEKIKELLEGDERANDNGWLQSVREQNCWVAEVLALVNQAETAPLMLLVLAISAACLHVGAQAVLAQQALDRGTFDEHDRELLGGLIGEIARGGQDLFAKSCTAMDLLSTTTDGEED